MENVSTDCLTGATSYQSSHVLLLGATIPRKQFYSHGSSTSSPLKMSSGHRIESTSSHSCSLSWQSQASQHMPSLAGLAMSLDRLSLIVIGRSWSSASYHSIRTSSIALKVSCVAVSSFDYFPLTLNRLVWEHHFQTVISTELTQRAYLRQHPADLHCAGEHLRLLYRRHCLWWVFLTSDKFSANMLV